MGLTLGRERKAARFYIFTTAENKKRLRVCLVEDTRVTHHDICYAVKGGGYSQAKNHLLYSGNLKKDKGLFSKITSKVEKKDCVFIFT